MTELEKVAEVLSIKEAAEAVFMSEQTIRSAIKSGELPAFIPRGREPLRAGPGLGYRIKAADLWAWYHGGQGKGRV